MRARTRRALLEELRARSGERRFDLLTRLCGRRHHFVDATRGIEQVLADEFILRIERRVAVRQHAVADAEDVRIAAEEPGNLLVAPDIERALHFVRRT